MADHVYGFVKNASSMGALLKPELLYIYMLALEFIKISVHIIANPFHIFNSMLYHAIYIIFFSALRP